MLTLFRTLSILHLSGRTSRPFPLEPIMKPVERLMTHSELTAALTAAIVAALKAGMSKEDVAASVQRVLDLLESED